MKKTVIFLLFVAALIYYGANNFIDSPLNGDNDKTAEVPSMKTDSDSLAVEDTAEDIAGKKNSSSPAGINPHSDNPAATKPLEPAIRDAVRELVDTSHDGLVVEKTANGDKLNLNGKFRTAPVATIDENGELTVRDYTAPPAK